MTVTPIYNDDDLKRAIERIAEVWGAPAGTPDGDEYRVLLDLIEAYESRHHHFAPIDPISFIQRRMKELDLKQRDLAKALGHPNVASEILLRKRNLTLDLIRKIAAFLKVPAAVLLGPTPEEAWQHLERVVREHAIDPVDALAALRAIASEPQLLCYLEGASYLNAVGARTKSDSEGVSILDVPIPTKSADGAALVASAYDVWAHANGHRKASTRFAA